MANEHEHKSGRPRDRKKRSPLAVVGTVLSSLLLLVVLVVGAAAIAVPKLAGAVPLTVLSNSMAPTMPVGSLAVVKPTMDTLTGEAAALDTEQIDAVNRIDHIGVGDVIVYAPKAGEAKLVIHRVTGLNVTSNGQRVFTTQGDNNNTADEPVHGYQVRAVLWYQLPLLGYVNNAVDGDVRPAIALGAAVVGYLWAMSLFIRAIRGGKRTAPARAANQQPEAATA